MDGWTGETVFGRNRIRLILRDRSGFSFEANIGPLSTFESKSLLVPAEKTNKVNDSYEKSTCEIEI